MSRAVIDLGFGDSGKGCTTDFLCSLFSPRAVARFSGGHQAGHHVVHDNIDHVFSSFGSGTLKGYPTYLEPTVIIYPVAILNELKVLKDKGIQPRLFIHRDCRVATFFDVVKNRANEDTLKHGSCGVGIFETFKRSNNHFTLTAGDLLFESVLRFKLQAIANHYYNTWNVATQIHAFMKVCDELLDMGQHVTIVDECPFDVDDMIYEGSQGLLLDENIGFFPHVTPSSVGSKFFHDNDIELKETYYVTRAYQTRHGTGPMTYHGDDYFEISDEYDKTNKFNEYQRDMRATMLDLDLIQYALKEDGRYNNSHKKLVITCLEHITKYYCFFWHGNIHSYETYEEFAKAIAVILGFLSTDVYLCSEYKFTKLNDKG